MLKLSALLVATSLILSISTFSQKKISLSVFTGSGISFFRGSGAVSKSIYHLNNTSGSLPPHPFIPDTIDNPYGKKLFANFLAGVQADILLHSKWVFLISSQYEQVGGKLNPDTIVSTTGRRKVDGEYKRLYGFLSVNPQIVRIIFQKQVMIELHAGLDYAFALSIEDEFDYTDQSGKRSIIGYSGYPVETNDLRFTIGSAFTRKKWTLDLNYKHGLSNYNKNGNDKVFSRILHIRLMYAFLKSKK